MSGRCWFAIYATGLGMRTTAPKPLPSWKPAPGGFAVLASAGDTCTRCGATA